MRSLRFFALTALLALATGSCTGDVLAPAPANDVAQRAAGFYAASAPTVDIVGPPSSRPHLLCSWQAVTDGGTPTSFTWSSSSPDGFGSWDHWYGDPASSFTISVDVTFLGGATAHKTVMIPVFGLGEGC